MYTKGDACATCSRNCFLMHRKKHDICSFFKIMFAETFDKLLVLPPIFSKKLKSLEGTKMTLEDTNKRIWDVVLSDVEGALAFRKGWRNFALDHNIERGDLLVFFYVGESHFLVEFYGKSGCQKKVTSDGMNNKRTEATKTSLPKKRPSQFCNEQSAPKRYYSSYAFPGPNDATPRPKNVHVVREPSVVTRNVPSRGHIHESRPKVAPVAETFVNLCSMTSREKVRAGVFSVAEPMVESSFPEPVTESSFPEPVTESSFRTNRDKNILNGIPAAKTLLESCSMINGEKKRPKTIPDPETLLDPYSMTNQDKSRPKVVQLDETLVEPCFMTTRDECFTMEDDRKCLFDLSVFEMPDKSTTDKKNEIDYLLDFPIYDLPENEAGANRSGGPPLLGPGTFENTVTEIADKNTTIIRDNAKDYILNKSTFEMPENEYTNASNKCQLHENPQCQEPDHNQNAESEAALINFQSCQITERKSEIEASDVGLPIDTIMPMPLNFILPKTTELPTVSGQNLMLNNRETRSYNQKVRGHAKGESSLGASSSVSEQNYGDLEGTNMRRIKQESSEFKDLKQDLCGHATKQMVKIEENVNKNNIAKLEPECDASATPVQVICSVSQDYLELPYPLPVAVLPSKSRSKFNQQLVFLRDPYERLWPVVYHLPCGLQVLASGWSSFMKANYIRPGDHCIFTLEDSLESTCTVQIDHLSLD